MASTVNANHTTELPDREVPRGIAHRRFGGADLHHEPRASTSKTASGTSSPVSVAKPPTTVRHGDWKPSGAVDVSVVGDAPGSAGSCTFAAFGTFGVFDQVVFGAVALGRSGSASAPSSAGDSPASFAASP